MKWIDAGDIKNWVTGKSRHCQQTLPELIRRLILAHAANTIEEFEFPSGDSVAMGGWDGRLRTPIISPFFPSGASGWEIGTERSAGTKAETDYKKRTTDPLGFTVADTTFVFVTPRPWPERIKWRSDKQITKRWKDVRVISADGLEQWLDSTPAVALWLARQIGKISPNNGFRDLEAFWEEWAVGTSPSMTPNLVISGRTKDSETIQKWIDENPRILEVLGDHPEEALAFLYSAITTMPEMNKTQALSRCIVVENINEMRQLIQAFQNSPLIIAAPGECLPAAPAAVAKGHHVFITMDAAVIGVRQILRLARPQRGVIEKILHEQGVSEADSQRYARDSGHSIPVLRRRLALSNAVNIPKWASDQSVQWLMPVLFAGAWSEEKEGDRKIIETLSGMKHNAFIAGLKPFLAIDDSPIRKVGSIWMIKSPLDAWQLLRAHLTVGDLALFEKSILSVLTETDPKYSLSPEKRWAAGLYGKLSPYSDWIRTGLVESLTLLAVHGDGSSEAASHQTFADRVVGNIFTATNKWETWASLKKETPLLAEAAPDAFMNAVAKVLKKAPRVFQELMEGNAGIFDECKHSGLLWALEGIAWSSDYFASATVLLADLADIDKGGKWENRAANSLKDIFRPGFPQTYATPEERLSVLDALISKHPKLIWNYAQSYYRQGAFAESHQFRWREAGGTRRGLEPEDTEYYRRYLAGFLPKLADLACTKENVISTVDIFTSLPTSLQTRLLGVLSKTDPASFPKKEVDKLLDGLRDALSWINGYGDETIRKQAPALEHALKKYEAKDPLERLGWILSTPWPKLPDAEKEYNERNAIVKKAQAGAAREILDTTPVDKILTFAQTVPYPGVFGQALGKVIQSKKEDASILDAMIKHIKNIPILIQGYADGRIITTSQAWITEQIVRMKAKGNYSPEACALFYLGLPENGKIWTEVGRNGKEVEIAYWKHARGHSSTDRIEDAATATEKLLEAKRPDQALEIAGDPKVSIPSSLLQRLIEEFLSMGDEKRQARAMDEYHFGNIFNQLYQRNELSIEELVKLEWPFAKLFDGIRRETTLPMAIHRLLQKDPLFFSQLITFLYKRDDRTPDPTQAGVRDEIIENRAQGAREVLHSWHLLPGLKDDGGIDEKKLIDWVEAARKQCSETNHTATGDLQIGFMLAHAPMGSDGAWPHEAIRNLLERLGNDEIERHIRIGLYNNRGVVTRSPNDGGMQERELSKKYRDISDIVKAKWPRTAAMLRAMAKSYEHDAEREDIDTDLRNIRWD